MYEQKELLKDIVLGLQKFLEEARLGNKEKQEIKKRIADFNKKAEEKTITQTKEIVSELQALAKIIPSLKIVLPKKYQVEVVNQIREVSVSKPSWYQPFVFKADDIVKPLINYLKKALLRVRVDQDKRNAGDYVNVRLTDGKKFYKGDSGGGYVAFGGPDNVGLKNASDARINPATEDKQDDIKSVLDQIQENTDTLELKAENVNLNTDELEGKADDVITELQALNSLIPSVYDYIALTYVAAGNGAGEIETIIFKSGGSGGTTVSTLTLTYNDDDEISSVTKS